MDLRPLAPGDVEAWADLLADAEAADRTGDHLVAADLREEMADPDLAAEDFLGAFDGGRLVGVATVLPRGETEGAFRVLVDGVVAPDSRGRGLGTALTSRALERAVAIARARRPDLPVRVGARALSGNDDQGRLLTSLGLRPDRRTLAMRRSLVELPAPAPVPHGFRLTPYEHARADDVRRAHNEAFGADHPGFTPWTPTAWVQWVTGSRMFRPDLSRVAVQEDTGAIAAYVLTEEPEGHLVATGRREAHISRVGTLREHRGRGLAHALIVRCLHAYAAAGCATTSLHVDAENPSGARRVYERVGFAVAATWTAYVLDVEPLRT